MSRPASRAFGKYGELWVASQVMRAGLQNVVVAQDRLRVDCIDLLLHDLESYAIGGLVVHTSTVNERGVQFRIRQGTFFIEPQLLVVVIPCTSEGALHKTAFLIPSSEVPSIATVSSDRGDAGYKGSFRLDPVAAKMRPFAVPMEKVGVTVLERLFPGRLSDRARPTG